MDVKIRNVNQVVIFDIEGEIRASDVPKSTLHELVKRQLESGKKDVLFDLKDVGFIDSYGVGEILASFISIQNSGGRMKLCHVPARVLIIFDVTNLNRVLDICEDCDGALKSFGTGRAD